MEEFNLEIITPIRKYLSMKAETIIINTIDVQRSFYANMYDLITSIEICPLTIKHKGHITNYAISGGTLHIDSKTNTISLLLSTLLLFNSHNCLICDFWLLGLSTITTT